jgi:hypothetical protein
MRAKRWEEASTLLERVIQHDATPATLAMALPLLRQIAHATQGTDRELIDAGVLANALLRADRYAEAEQIQRDLMSKLVKQGNYRLASVCAGDLLILLRRTGRLQDALALAEQMAEFTRRAGLGPWTQLVDEGMRLQILNALGHHQEVLDAVQNLRGQLAALPEQSQAEETAIPWNVREALLDTGRTAAMRLEEWETALDLNAEILRFKRQRGAGDVELAHTRFNDYSSLLHQRRFREAREVLEDCRAVYEQAHAILQLCRVFGALADLEYKEGHSAAAVRFQQVGLHYSYQVGQPEDCATSHNNLAEYLQRAPADLAGLRPTEGWHDLRGLNALAHRLAAGITFFQIGSGSLARVTGNLTIEF